jgi:hypothetical protein
LLDEPLVILIILERMPCAEICLLTWNLGDLYCSDTWQYGRFPLLTRPSYCNTEN